MDFDLAKKHSKEVEQRRREAKRKLDQQRKDEAQQTAMEQEYREREEIRLRKEREEALRAEQEAAMNDGVQYIARLRPYPSSRTDDKLELPPSALEELERQGALERGTLLTFAVSLPGQGIAAEPLSSPSAGSTHAGVAEFTAEEGTVGVPPRVALCLTKGSGLETLDAVGQVEIRYVRLPRCSKSRVKLQPRGEGFHAGGMKTIQMDLEHVLLETLRGHTALTQGDWLPIRHAGQTFELMVRELEPHSELALIDTDLTVEVLPSEQTEAEARAEEERVAQAEAAAREAEHKEELRLQRCKTKAAELPLEPAAGPDVVQLLVRLPAGARLSRRFIRSTAFEQVLNWVESEPDALVQAGEFRVVQKWPGHCRELGPSEAAETLASLGFGRQEALFLQHLGSEAEAEVETIEEKPSEDAGAPTKTTAASGNGAWSQAEEQAHAMLDRRLEGQGTPTAAASNEPQLEEIRGEELVAVFERLVALGMQPPKAAAASKRFAAQLKELGEMGFENWIEAVDLLEKYNGRLLRVANLLTESVFEGHDSMPGPAPLAPAPAAPAAPAVTAAPSKPQAPALPVDKERVTAKFKELVAGGMNPNDAASQAILTVRQEMAAEVASVAASVATEAPAPADPVASVPATGAIQEKLQELVSMGFADEARNKALLTKYGGRMERVIEALCS
mmetsp:Transcript_21825/g.39159  ORF Transcript_21825/g.39159 Transcript_21825/m.39159 type:complete len:677 (-) Transcript_21825:92-2122(-)|eukprot:CAMPEP_0197657626 /NCGR_PEP_ID=MMETSP1338-20131121/44745_1 /TAXON_ID=43686 ORGANISM="Pelagodinium beii, Strain RCC1491" /NCGR_SAMPLE_ID=MMETSP1338 /ASSEMBLY_ACC=CAM_ASM_000754 /LENGTH=676 /DNA_ID=CAMNT_0043234041 /DNA_START=102 /DNA_END=2132 /DNA_ORIENTATION=-